MLGTGEIGGKQKGSSAYLSSLLHVIRVKLRVQGALPVRHQIAYVSVMSRATQNHSSRSGSAQDW